MRLLHLIFLLYYLGAAESLRRKEKFTSNLNKLNNYGLNKPIPSHFRWQMHDPVNKRTQNTRRDKYSFTGQIKDGRHYLGWLPWIGMYSSKGNHSRKSHRRNYIIESGRDSSTPKKINISRSQLGKNWLREERKANVGTFGNMDATSQIKNEKPYRSWLPGLAKNHKDTVLVGRKASRHRRRYTDESGRESSTSMEMQKWKSRFDEDWVREKEKAIKEKLKMPPVDIANMVAARPWSRPCGDPMQHDVAWGTCTLSFQCMPEFRIYRGDFQCGRTQFVCCGILTTHHDMFQGIDMSFVDTGSTSSGERLRHEVKSAQIRFNKRHRERIRRWKARNRSKERMKRLIKKLSHEIKKNLFRAFRNNSMAAHSKVKLLKKTIKLLKSKYRNERHVIKNKVDDEIEDINKVLEVRLANMNWLNVQYLTNDTFRAILRKYNITVSSLTSMHSIPSQLKDFLLGKKSIMQSDKEHYHIRKFADNDPNSMESFVKETKAPVNESSVEITDEFDEENPLQEQQIQDTLNATSSAPSDVTLNKTESLEHLSLETRRFGAGMGGKSNKHGKSRQFDDYLNYDIEYGALYY